MGYRHTNSASLEAGYLGVRKSWTAERQTRKPLLLFLFSGLLLFRLEQRKFLVLLLFQEPPRRTVCHYGSSLCYEQLRTVEASAAALLDCTFFNQPPSKLPISTTFLLAYSY